MEGDAGCVCGVTSSFSLVFSVVGMAFAATDSLSSTACGTERWEVEEVPSPLFIVSDRSGKVSVPDDVEYGSSRSAELSETSPSLDTANVGEVVVRSSEEGLPE